MLVKPLTYMNLSGESVGEIMNFYKLDPEEELLVIFDDISLAPGNIRIRKKGSAGGHNGIKNIIAHLGTQEFTRIKIGIGEKPAKMDLADYVLGHFSKEEQVIMLESMQDMDGAVNLMLEQNVDQAMNLYNKKKNA